MTLGSVINNWRISYVIEQYRLYIKDFAPALKNLADCSVGNFRFKPPVQNFLLVVDVVLVVECGRTSHRWDFSLFPFPEKLLHAKWKTTLWLLMRRLIDGWTKIWSTIIKIDPFQSRKRLCKKNCDPKCLKMRGKKRAFRCVGARSLKSNLFLFLFFIIYLSMFPIRNILNSIGREERKPVDEVLKKRQPKLFEHFSFSLLTRFEERR